jgi:hypothetical protein
MQAPNCDTPVGGETGVLEDQPGTAYPVSALSRHIWPLSRLLATEQFNHVRIMT